MSNCFKNALENTNWKKVIRFFVNAQKYKTQS
jgi:hypothetical protein